MMMTIMCIGMPNKGYQVKMINLPIRFSKKYQVNQVNHEVGKKHRRKSTYNNPNILILIIIPCKYLVIIPPCNYLVKHLFHQFIESILGITSVSKMGNHYLSNSLLESLLFTYQIIVPNIPPTINTSFNMNANKVIASHICNPEFLASFNMPIASTKSVNCAYIIYLISPINTNTISNIFFILSPFDTIWLTISHHLI